MNTITTFPNSSSSITHRFWETWKENRHILNIHWKKYTIHYLLIDTTICQQSYHPVAQDWLPTEAKQGWAWLVPGLETFWEIQVAAGRSEATLVVVEEIPCEVLWVPRKALYKCNELQLRGNNSNLTYFLIFGWRECDTISPKKD